MRLVIIMIGLVLLIQSYTLSQYNRSDVEANHSPSDSTTLKIITINVWSGLDYQGNFKFGEYESLDRREFRFKILVQQLKDLNPDILFVQEANPVGKYVSRLADSLAFDEIHQVCNAGIKIFGLGLPSNFEEGIAILARKDLHLKEYVVWKLSGSFGLFGDFISAHFDETEFAEAAQITCCGKPIFLVNVHLSAFPPTDSVVDLVVQGWLSSGLISRSDSAKAHDFLSYGSARRVMEVNELLGHIHNLPSKVPTILGGDFNLVIASKELSILLKDGGFMDAGAKLPVGRLYTWDPTHDANVSFSTQTVDASGDELDFEDRLSAAYDSKPRRIDFIFLDRNFEREDINTASIVLDSSFGGVQTSDHFGMMAEIKMSRVLDVMGNQLENESDVNRASIEPLPIVSYDTDIGFGYGAKLFLFDLMKMRESFDFVAFNSTKGERWYRGVFSIPDFESRQGTEYPFALDFTFDYDKWLKNNFYGVGNGSLFSSREQYTREPIEFDFAFSRGFTPNFVGEATITHKSIRNFNFGTDSQLKNLPPALNSGNAAYTSASLSLRYDTRNSFVNPSRGVVLDGEAEFSPRWDLGNTSFTRLAGWFQYYSVLFYPTSIFALRVGVQQVVGDSLPVQVLTSIGGNNTMRGYTQDRYLDKARALINSELRFPIYWRIGGVVGLDAGKVWESLTELDIKKWAVNPVVGLRLYMDNYVVRADMGFGRDGTGFYFNFGQIF